MVFRYSEHLSKEMFLDEDISNIRKTNLYYFLFPLFTAKCSYDETKIYFSVMSAILARFQHIRKKCS